MFCAVWTGVAVKAPSIHTCAQRLAPQVCKAVGISKTLTGMGVKGVVDGKSVALGNAKLLAELGKDGGRFAHTANARRDQGETVMFVLVGDEIAGLVSVADPVKDTTAEALKALKIDA